MIVLASEVGITPEGMILIENLKLKELLDKSENKIHELEKRLEKESTLPSMEVEKTDIVTKEMWHL